MKPIGLSESAARRIAGGVRWVEDQRGRVLEDRVDRGDTFYWVQVGGLLTPASERGRIYTGTAVIFDYVGQVTSFPSTVHVCSPQGSTLTLGGYYFARLAGASPLDEGIALYECSPDGGRSLTLPVNTITGITNQPLWPVPYGWLTSDRQVIDGLKFFSAVSTWVIPPTTTAEHLLDRIYAEVGLSVDAKLNVNGTRAGWYTNDGGTGQRRREVYRAGYGDSKYTAGKGGVVEMCAPIDLDLPGTTVPPSFLQRAPTVVMQANDNLAGIDMTGVVIAWNRAAGPLREQYIGFRNPADYTDYTVPPSMKAQGYYSIGEPVDICADVPLVATRCFSINKGDTADGKSFQRMEGIETIIYGDQSKSPFWSIFKFVGGIVVDRGYPGGAGTIVWDSPGKDSITKYPYDTAPPVPPPPPAIELFSVFGKVTYTGGAGANRRIVTASAGALNGSAVTATDGTYVIGGLSSATYTVAVTLMGGESSTPATRSIAVGPTATGADFVITRGGGTRTISGVVTGLGGGLVGRTVVLDDGRDQVTATTGAGGAYTVTAPGDGMYDLSVVLTAGETSSPDRYRLNVTGNQTGRDFVIGSTSSGGGG